MLASIAIVPVKSLAEAKSRLSPQLDADERVALVVGLLRSVLGALAAGGATERLVVSPDPAVLAVARAAGALVLHQAGEGLNAALELARQLAPPHTTLLVAPADLPLLGPDDVRAVLALALPGPVVVIAPDREEQGTNLLALPASPSVPFQFGAGSFWRHQAAARAAGLSVQTYRSPATALDLDTPADFAELRRRGWPSFGDLLPERGWQLATHGA